MDFLLSRFSFCSEFRTRVNYLCTLADVIKLVSRAKLWIVCRSDMISIVGLKLDVFSVPLSLEEICSVSLCPSFCRAMKKTKCPAVVTQFLRLMTASSWSGCAFSMLGQMMGWRTCGTSPLLGCMPLPDRYFRSCVLRDIKFWASAGRAASQPQVPMYDVPLTDTSVKCQWQCRLLVQDINDNTPMTCKRVQEGMWKWAKGVNITSVAFGRGVI